MIVIIPQGLYMVYNEDSKNVRIKNRHKMVFRQKCKQVTGLNLKMLFTSPLKVKGYAII